MIDLEKVLKEWEEDCQIQPNLSEASRETPKLHAKYLQYYTFSKLQLKRAETSQRILLKDKWLHYHGKLDEDTIREKGWKPDPLDGLKVLKGDLDRFFDSDPDIQKSINQIDYYKQLVETIKEMVDNIKWRHATIKNMLEWRRFESGG